MLRSVLAALVLGLGTLASASDLATMIAKNVHQMFASVDPQAGLHFVVGDQASYKLNLGGFLNGTMVMTVKSVKQDEVVITQDMDLGFQKQSCEETLNPNTGELKKLVCNGQEQNQDQGEIELVDSKEDKITVPAGTFECLYIKAKLKKDNSEVEQWVNPKQIPVFGMIKMIAPSQIGKMTVELSSFKKN